ncbi:MAG: precorrin-8X methylmutase, partial [Thermacetogeniaceae bacterium]
MKKGIVLLGHGSRRDAANAELKKLADLVRASLGMDVRPAFFQFSRPSLEDAVEGFVEDGIEDILVVPAFLFPGMHLEHDLPEALGELKARFGPELRLSLAPCLGADPRLVEVIADRVRTAIGSVPDLDVKEATGGELTDPDAITASSRLLIEDALGKDFLRKRFSEREGEVVRRVVHAMGNPSVASLMRFHPDAVDVGVAALRKGAVIFTDVQMVKIGINKSALRKLGGKAVCLIRHPGVRRIAREEGVTRALVAVRCFQELWRGQIVVVGNAPT